MRSHFRRVLREPALWASLAVAAGAGGSYVMLRYLFAEEFRPGLVARVGLFWSIWAGCIAAALLRGGAPERWMALAVGWPAPASMLIPFVASRLYSEVDYLRMAIDVLTLVGIWAVAWRANRYWPLLVVGIQLCGVMPHFVNMLAVPMHPLAYGMLSVVWSYLMLPLLPIGAWRHRMRLRRFGVDRDWSP